MDGNDCFSIISVNYFLIIYFYFVLLFGAAFGVIRVNKSTIFIFILGGYIATPRPLFAFPTPPFYKFHLP